MRILFVAPHLSTGGLPQYLFKKIETLHGDNDIYCVEYSNHSNSFVVQRDKIKNILKEKYFLLGDDKSELLRIIEKINPEIVHLEEIPEYFLEREIADRIYKPDREYKIFETSHDSSFDTNQKVYLPDKMMLVSRYQVDNFSKLEIPCVLMEYPIEYAEPFDKKLSQKLLGLDPNKKHVINVGLFTPRKNQAEIVEYAKRLLDYPIQFHFIGNQADNFQNYWQPIMKDFPPNCKWWGERSDVSKFYKAADLFLFTSRGTNSDKETSPLVIREAISYRVPSLIYNLPVYMGMYDNYPNIKYLNFENKEENLNKILESLNLQKTIEKRMRSFKNLSFSQEENKIYYSFNENLGNVKIAVKDITSGLTIYWTTVESRTDLNYWIIPIGEIKFGSEKSFKGFEIEVYSMNEELLLSQELIINDSPDLIDEFKFASSPFDRNWYNYYEFFYRNKYKGDFDISENDVVVDIGANCGTLTRYCVSKNARKVYSIEADPKAFKNLQKSFKDFKNVIPIHCLVDKTSGESQFYSCKSNTTISSKINAQVDMFYKNEDYEVTNIKSLSLNDLISQNNIKNVDYFKMDIEGAEYDSMSTLDWNFFAKHVKKFILEFHHYQKFKNEFENIKSKLLENGFDIVKINHVTKDISFDYEKDEMGVLYAVNSKIQRPVIKCVHLLSRTDDEREIRSVASVAELAKLGFRYTQNINKPYSDLPPNENCARPNDIAMEPGKMKLSPGHYGCYLAHSSAILSEFDPEKHDAILIFECDAIAKESIKSLEKEILMAYDLCENQGLLMYSFGCNYDPNAIDKGDYLEASSFYEAHAYLITKSNYKLIREKIKSTKWDVFDLWIADNLKGFKFGVSKKPYVLQAKGYSLLDKKISEKNFLNVEKL